MNAALSDVVISRRGGFDPRPLPAADVLAGWAVNDVGLLSCRVRPADLLALGLPGHDPRFCWLSWTHPSAGTWAGQVVADRWRPGEVELTCEGWLSLLRRRRTARTYASLTATPGHLFARILKDVVNDDPLPLRPPAVDGDGEPFTVEWRGDDALEVALRLAFDGGMEVTCRADRVPRFGVRVGLDRSGTVLLSDGPGGCIVDYDWSRDGWTVENDRLAVAGDDDFARASAYTVEDRRSIQRFGRKQGSQAYPGLVHKSTLEARAKRDVAQTADGASVLELELADVGGVWSAFAEGDSVTVLLGSASARLVARVMVRTLDLGRGVMRLSCDVEEEVAR